jgi:heterodisulfide reductase subunit C
MSGANKLRDQILSISGADPRRCMKCGKCSGACPSYNEMEFRPHRFVSMVEKGDIEPLLRSKAIYRCLACMACVERCPRNVEPAKFVEAVRLVVIRRQGGNHMLPDDIPEKLDPDLPQQAIVAALRKYGK